MKYILRLVFFILLPLSISAQQNYPDSLKLVLKNVTADSVKFQLYTQLTDYYDEIDKDSAFHYSDICLELAIRNKKSLSEANTLTSRGRLYSFTRQYGEALQYFLRAFEIAEDPESEKSGWFFNTDHTPRNERLRTLSTVHFYYSVLMKFTQNHEQAIVHLKEGLNIAEKINYTSRIIGIKSLQGNTYLEMNKSDSALIVEKEAMDLALQNNITGTLPVLYWNIGQAYMSQGNKQLGQKYFYKSIQVSKEQNSNISELNYLQLTNFYLGENEKDSALFYAKKSFQAVQRQNIGMITGNMDLGEGYENLYLSYKLRNQLDSAYKYQGLALIVQDSLSKMRLESMSNFQKLTLSEQLRLRDVEKQKELYQSKLKTYTSLAGLSLILLIALILYRSNRQKRKTNKALETTLSNLKSTQAQLIQSEKMASLGELTAGIAHEIQNPLNFVNNFSEVSSELIQEIKDERHKNQDQRDEGLEEEILTDIEQNLEKINHHGNRASGIVKGMLEHSRTSSGEKELVDINALADEYLRLSYHGLSAKDDSFEADFKTDFDKNLPKLEVVSQDIGRVLLNLINNGFQASSEEALKRKSYSNEKEAKSGRYKPTLTVSTKSENDNVIITVKDNGSGISDEIKDKIFQPFFTTKDTGKGTGLGLSLAYDIVKAHGGELTLETGDDIGAEFIIHLPIN